MDKERGLSGQDAERLVRSGDDLLDGDRNQGREAMINEIQTVVERVKQQHRIQHLDVVAALEFVKLTELNAAVCEGCEGCDEEGGE